MHAFNIKYTHTHTCMKYTRDQEEEENVCEERRCDITCETYVYVK